MKNIFSIIAMLMVLLMAGCKKDVNTSESAPQVKSTDPINIATGLAINSRVSATFDVEMDASTLNAANFTLQKGSIKVPGAVAYAGTTATFTPTSSLDPNTVYTATVTNSARNKNGKPMEKAYTWSFTTGAAADHTLPTVTLTDPANIAISVPLNNSVKATFSKPMDQTTITSATFTVKEGTVVVAGAITYTGVIATFKPSVDLKPKTNYICTITTGVKDMAGNAMANSYTFNFTTNDKSVVVFPTVISTDPINNATGVAQNKVISVSFSEAMDPASIKAATFNLMQGTTAIAGVVIYSGTTAKFTPSAVLAANTVYIATVTTGVKNLAGNALAANKVISFTTFNAPIGAKGPTPVDLGTAGNFLILAKTQISVVPTSVITGDLGLSPAATSYITGLSLTNATGYATSAQVTGKIFAADMVTPTSGNLTTAVHNMEAAYTDAAGRPTPDFLNLGTGNIGGRILTAGLYKFTTSVTVPADVTFSGGANDVFILQIAGDLTLSPAVKVTLIGGVQAKNIFWQLSGTALVKTNAHFEGIILSQTGITLETGASYKGRALAQTAVILDKNIVTLP